MFIPNGYCQIRKLLPSFNVYGEPEYGPLETIPFAQVRFDTKIEDSTVRADSSATRGNVKEFHASGRCLVPKTVIPNWGDIFIIHGKTYRCKQVEPRYNVVGQLDHFQVDYSKAEDYYEDEA